MTANLKLRVAEAVAGVSLLFAVSVAAYWAAISLSASSFDTAVMVTGWGGIASVALSLVVMLVQFRESNRHLGDPLLFAAMVHLLVMIYFALMWFFFRDVFEFLVSIWTSSVAVKLILGGVFPFASLILARRSSWLGSIGCSMIWFAIVTDVTRRSYFAT
jgi:hypothetical protein